MAAAIRYRPQQMSYHQDVWFFYFCENDDCEAKKMILTNHEL